MKATEVIFRAYDIRGVYGEELDAEIGERVGLAFGNFLRKQYNGGKISIGCDARVSSPELQMAVSKGVSRAGFDVDIIGMVPIPVANYFTWKSNLTSEEYVAGVYITASHNPAEYNGIRFRHPDGTGFTEGNVEIKRIFFEEKLVEQSENIVVMRSGKAVEKNWIEKNRDFDVFDLKADLNAIFEIVNLDSSKIDFSDSANSYYHPGKNCSIKFGNKTLGSLGQIHPQIIKDFGLNRELSLGTNIFGIG